MELTIHQPGAIRRASWMSKLTYSLEIFLFRSQFKLTKLELLGRLRDFLVKEGVFEEAVHLSSPTSTPRNDLPMLGNIKAYKTFDAPIALAAMKSFSK